MYRRMMFIATCLIGSLIIAAAQTANDVTRHISSVDGLSNDFVTELATDGMGYVWVATEAGVNRIAGNTCQPMFADLLADNLITALRWHAASGRMLIGTEHGLLVYQPKSGDLRYLKRDDGLIMSSINDIAEAGDGGVWLVYGRGPVQHLDCATLTVTDLPLHQPHSNRCALDDGNGNLYIGHSQHGMTVVNINSLQSKNYRQQDGQDRCLPGNNVRRIYKDRSGRVWVGTDTGLALYDPTRATFLKVTGQPDVYDDNVYDICQAADGRIWVATDIGGIKVLDAQQAVADGMWRYEQTTVTTSSLNTRAVVTDEFGNIWVGNHSTGVDFISDSRQDFNLLDFAGQHGHHPSVSAIAADPQQGIWMANESELMWWLPDGMKSRWSYLNRMRREYAFPRCMMADHHGGVWLGIDDQGVYRFDKQSGQFAYIPIQPDGSDIHCFAEDSQGRIWIGGEFGVYCYENGRAVSRSLISRTLKAPATCIMEMPAGHLFVATLGDGIYSFNLNDGSFRHLNVSDGLPSSKVNHTILSATGVIWLATDGGLVCVQDPVGLTGITVYGRQQGLTDNHVLALQQDAKGDIWVSTYAGISCFVMSGKHFYNYQNTRLLGAFAKGAAMTDISGAMFFGAVSGVCTFNPQQMGNSQPLSDIQIISCEAYNPVGSNTEIRLLTPDENGRVFTSYRQNTIRLIFGMRNFAEASAVDYAYMMKGMDGKWYEIGNDHNVVFRGLRPGEYTFILRAKLRNQDWDQARETQLSITIAPPFWRTWWAYVFYVLIGVAVACWLAHVYRRRLTQRSNLEIERRESEQKQQLNEERLRFFTNITHELRTPLTLILGPIDDLMADSHLSQQNRRHVTLIQKNAERLRELINEILEFRKIETQNRRLTVARGDIGQFVREIYLNYKELNRNPKVAYACKIDDNLPPVWFDSEVITTIMANFLTNASKYTEQGCITTSVKTRGGQLFISVADTGCGIAADALPHVFERYYQANGSHQASGTGIGLALVKSLAELHEGDVSVESREGQGSTFSFALTIDNTYPNALHKEDVITEESRDEQVAECETDVVEDAHELPLLLVVEDNADIRQYIADSFSEDFSILQAENGEEGMKMAREHMPDIIVSDIMMPRMNGIQLTRQLKDDLRTSHIPIILLTAKTTDDDKEEGYDSGADSYLTKPFSSKLLGSRIRNLLAGRRRLAEYLARHAATPIGTAGQEATAVSQLATDEEAQVQAAVASQLSRLDREFLDKLHGVIRDNIMRQNIDLPFVTDKMAMSHSTFYRKVKALTGMTATEYIRKFRLQYCYQLLESGDYNVSQAAMMTGFNQMAHFRETFKKEFGILPSEVMKRFLSLTTLFLLACRLLAATIDVRAFGAKGDGVNIDSPAINAAISQAAQEGGGTVSLSAGTYLCYSIHLQSNVTIRLEHGAVIKAAPVTDSEGYDAAEPSDSHYQDFGHSHWHNSLIWGENLHHVTIEGDGLIDGTDVLSRGEPRRGYQGPTVANKALALRDSHHVTIRGVSFLRCGHFALLLTGVDDLLIDGVTCDTNRDGFDIDCCERVVVRNCKVNTLNDDAIVLKCSYALGRPKPTEHVLIEDCHVSGYDVGSFFDGTMTTKIDKAPDGDGPTGRIKLGTESNGGFRHITIRRCVFTHCRGLALETVDGAEMCNIRVSDLQMHDICNSPIYIRLGNRMRAPEGFHSSKVHDIRISNVHVTDADSRYACLIAGVQGHPVRDVRIRNLYVMFRGGLTMEDFEQQRGVNPFFVPKARKAGQRGEANYPEPSAHGIQPAWGFSISHAEDVRLDGVHLALMKADERPAYHFEHTKNIRISRSSRPRH